MTRENILNTNNKTYGQLIQRKGDKRNRYRQATSIFVVALGLKSDNQAIIKFLSRVGNSYTFFIKNHSITQQDILRLEQMNIRVYDITNETIGDSDTGLRVRCYFEQSNKWPYHLKGKGQPITPQMLTEQYEARQRKQSEAITQLQQELTELKAFVQEIKDNRWFTVKTTIDTGMGKIPLTVEVDVVNQRVNVYRSIKK